ncbi:DUF4926 domain-containing protein [Enterobacteriaceae bacterium ESL0689]|nr:DUF4926 domain-containing protein [Enterobacteriaceae bacterium ESL0689]
MIKEYDVVRATKTLSNKVLKGCVGTILMIYNNPTLGYEIEFVDENCNTLDVLTVSPKDIEPLDNLCSRDINC